MNIFIDESGTFSPLSKEGKASWSSVGALVVPDESMEELSKALSELKQYHDVPDNKEFKPERPDCNSEGFENLLLRLKELNCTLHVLSNKSHANDLEKILSRKQSIKKAVINYTRKATNKADKIEELVSLYDNLSNQLFAQFIYQSLLIKFTLDKIPSFYAEHSPQSLSHFKWVIDQKDIFETEYEKVFKKLYIGFILEKCMTFVPAFLNGNQRDYHYFINSYQAFDHINRLDRIADSEKLFDLDLSSVKNFLRPFDIIKLLADDLQLEDSQNSPGIQVVDLLVSGVNRCLKGNFTDNAKMANSLGRLMINSPHDSMGALSLVELAQGQDARAPDFLEYELTIIRQINGSALKLYSELFRSNYSKSLSKIVRR